MQLRQTETLCLHNHHHAGIRHIHAHLYNSCRHEQLGLAAGKALHLLILLGRLHLAVNLAHAIVREHPLQFLITSLQVLQVHLLALLYQRIDHIDLPSLRYLAAYALIEAQFLLLILVDCHYRLASRGQFVYHAHVQIPIDSHSQGAGNRCRRHYQHMRRVLILCPQFGSLSNAKAMLLVYNGKSEIMELHRVLDDGMRAYQYIHAAIQQSLHHLLALFAFHYACQQFHSHGQVAEKVAYSGKMLLRQYLRRCHHHGLETVIHRYQHGHQRHESLA